ncbi:MAG: hypothetical protein HOE80_03925 [Candidatus Magasanikbacteria bacterium]|jgi:hypothetical protein|nr:hypothetical protein [Candidatus Magasanikbacteria bacterium]MBT4071841.1 hypothetical protein [Candidatus Magasanikbacteria bacterium]
MIPISLLPHAKKDLNIVRPHAHAYVILGLLSLRQPSKTGVPLKGALEGLFSLPVAGYTIIYMPYGRKKARYVVRILG